MKRNPIELANRIVDFCDALADRNSVLRERPDLSAALTHATSRYNEMKIQASFTEAARTAKAEGIALLIEAG